MAATETGEPEKWLAYAQDRKVEDSRYSVADFRRDIQQAHLNRTAFDAQDFKEERQSAVELPRLQGRACPWVKLVCLYSGKPVALSDCRDCEFDKTKICETEPNFAEA